MENIKILIDELRKCGLSNGGALGHHSGLMDEAADLIEKQQAEIEEYKHLEVVLNTAVDILAQDLKSKAMKEFLAQIKPHAYYIDFPKEHRVIDEDDVDRIAEQIIKKPIIKGA